MQGHTEKVFPWQLSIAFLYSVEPVYLIVYQHQNFASLLHLHSAHDKILLISNYAFIVADASNSHMATII